MKKLLICIFLIGLFAIGYSPPPDVGAKQIIAKTEFAQAVDQVQAPVMNVVYSVDVTALPVPDTPERVNWMIEIPALAVLSTNRELIENEMYSSNNILTLNETIELSTHYRPDRSLNNGQLAIRDKL